MAVLFGDGAAQEEPQHVPRGRILPCLPPIFAGEGREPPASFPAYFIFLEFPLLVPFYYYYYHYSTFPFFLITAGKNNVLPWQHAPKLLMTSRRARSCRAGDHDHGGGGSPELPKNRVSALRQHRAPTGLAPFPLQAQQRLQICLHVPWDHEARRGITSCWSRCRKAKKIIINKIKK